MIDETNPAGRLYKILSIVKKEPDTKSAKVVWGKALGDLTTDVDITNAVVALYLLSQETQSLIKMKEGLNHNLYLASFSRIDRVFFPLQLGSTWAQSRAHLTDEALIRLQFCAQELSGVYSEESLSEEDLLDIITKTNELYNSLHDSTLPSTLRMTLLEEVQRIRNAISLYQIKGAKGLKEGLQGAIGAVVANQEALKSAKNGDKDVMKRLGDLLDKMDSFSSKALKVNKIIKKPIGFLIEEFGKRNAQQDEGEYLTSET